MHVPAGVLWIRRVPSLLCLSMDNLDAPHVALLLRVGYGGTYVFSYADVFSAPYLGFIPVFGRFDLAALGGCHTLNVCYVYVHTC